MRLKDKALRWGVGFLIVAAALYLVAAFMYRDPGLAWDLLGGTASPRGVRKPALAYSVSVIGYILVPVAIAVVFSGLVDVSVRRKELESGGAEEQAAGILPAPRQPGGASGERRPG
jgi:hypothetical protein